jgi:hypothetical protein
MCQQSSGVGHHHCHWKLAFEAMAAEKKREEESVKDSLAIYCQSHFAV